MATRSAKTSIPPPVLVRSCSLYFCFHCRYQPRSVSFHLSQSVRNPIIRRRSFPFFIDYRLNHRRFQLREFLLQVWPAPSTLVAVPCLPRLRGHHKFTERAAHLAP